MPKTVLIVDDEPVLRENLSKTLIRSGLRTDGAASLDQALTAIYMRDYDLICVDIHLGDENGFDLIKLARELRPDLPVIVMTGQDSMTNRTRAESLEAAAFLAKPFGLNRFRELVRCLIGSGDNAGITLGREKTSLSVMMYSHDSIGLGHLRRNTNIASRLVRDVPNLSVLMMVGCPAGVVFDLPQGVDFIKLPSIVKIGRNSWESGKLRIPKSEARDLRMNLLLRATEIFRPDVFLADHVPAGVWGELLPTLNLLKNQPDRPRVMLGFRDILDRPEHVAQTWERDKIREIIATYYDDILIYGSRDVYDTVSAYDLEHIAPGRSKYCGYVISDDAGDDPETVRGHLGIGNKSLMLVTAGGGYDAFPMMSQCLDALEIMSRKDRPAAIFVTGPLMEEDLRTQIATRAEALKAHTFKSVPNCQPYIRAADVVVTMGGYNTLVEAVHFGKPTIVIPRIGPSAEQRTRTERFAKLGLLQCLLPAETNPTVLSNAILAALKNPPRANTGIQTTGVSNAVSEIKRALGANQDQALPLQVAI